MAIVCKLKLKHRGHKDNKSTRRVKAGNSATRSKAVMRGPRVPVSLSLAGARGWRPEMGKI